MFFVYGTPFDLNVETRMQVLWSSKGIREVNSPCLVSMGGRPCMGAGRIVSLSACKASSFRGGENLQEIIENLLKEFNHFKQQAVLTYFFVFGTFCLNMPKPSWS